MPQTQQDPSIIFFGTPDFAADALRTMLDRGIVPAAVVCNPDRPMGRKKIVTAPAVKRLAMEYATAHPKTAIRILQPEHLDPAFKETLASLRPDLFVVAAFAKIIKQDILDVPRLGTIGIHPSLLPEYRGASPIQSAILAGERTTGVTLYQMDAKMDHGPVLAQAAVDMDDLAYPELSKRLADAGGALLAKTLPSILNGSIEPQEQDHARATFTAKFATDDGFIDIHDIARAQTEGGSIAHAVEYKVRALNPEPGTWTMAEGICGIRFGHEKRVKLMEVAVSMENTLVIKKIQVEGKEPIELHHAKKP